VKMSNHHSAGLLQKYYHLSPVFITSCRAQRCTSIGDLYDTSNHIFRTRISDMGNGIPDSRWSNSRRCLYHRRADIPSRHAT